MSEMDEAPGKQGTETPLRIRVTDRRSHFGDRPSEESPSEPFPEHRYPSFVAEMEARTRSSEAKLAEALDLLRRREAEADEFRSRLRREMERRSRTQLESAVREFLEVLDSLDRGVAAAEGETDPGSLRRGLIQVRDQFFSALARQGIEPMNLVGSVYDPHQAEAVAIAPAGEGEEENKVVEEIRRGFTLAGQVLRPAQVRVARRMAPPEDAGPSAPGS